MDKMHYIPQTHETAGPVSSSHPALGAHSPDWKENEIARTTQSKGAFLSLVFERTVPNSSTMSSSTTSNHRLNIVNLHLDGFYSEHFPRSWINEFRCNQLRTIEFYTEKHRSGKNTSVSWMGDFNATEPELRSFMTSTQRFDYVHKLNNSISRQYNFNSERNCRTHGRGIDHIYTRNIFNRSEVQIIPDSLYTWNQYGKNFNAPYHEQSACPSDHFALYWYTKLYQNHIDANHHKYNHNHNYNYDRIQDHNHIDHHNYNERTNKKKPSSNFASCDRDRDRNHYRNRDRDRPVHPSRTDYDWRRKE
jgi:hypothetical protein